MPDFCSSDHEDTYQTPQMNVLMMVPCFQAITDLTEKLNLAEKIIRLGELNRKMMTEREKVTVHLLLAVGAVALPICYIVYLCFMKVLPFEFAATAEGSAEGDDLDAATAAVGDEVKASASTLGTDGKPVQEWDALNTFFTRHNKILLDKTALEVEGKRLSQENDRLRGLIKQFVDGISVNDDVMSNANSLMVVNNSLTRLPRMPGPDHVTVVDGPQVLNLMEMQNR